jgi:signal transduction histidine kinase
MLKKFNALIAKFSHEARTPLTSAMLNVQILQRGLEMNKELSKEQLVERLENVYNQLKTISDAADKFAGNYVEDLQSDDEDQRKNLRTTILSVLQLKLATKTF